MVKWEKGNCGVIMLFLEHHTNEKQAYTSYVKDDLQSFMDNIWPTPCENGNSGIFQKKGKNMFKLDKHYTCSPPPYSTRYVQGINS